MPDTTETILVVKIIIDNGKFKAVIEESENQNTDSSLWDATKELWDIFLNGTDTTPSMT
jgi:hypothetical protein